VAHLDKRIPVGGGLGGGSADAAAAIDCSLQMWGVGLSPSMLDAVALELGADVPFFVRDVAAALVSGRGETVERLPLTTDYGLLLVTPPIAMSTAAVFARFDELQTPIGQDDINDLWPAAVSLAPELGTMRAELERLSAKAWLMSGSGSTLFTVFDSGEEAAAAGRSLVASESEGLGGALINAVDLVGPDPLWRYP
jgi:4-diphosphocytidyl-2-C-methyl-D-erythritol kinase